MTIDKMIVYCRVDEFEQCEEFAEQVLQLKLWKKKEHCNIYLLNEQIGLAYCRAGSEDTCSEGILISWVTDQVDDWYCKFNDHKFAITEPKKNEKYNIYHFFGSDPAGNTFELMKFLD